MISYITLDNTVRYKTVNVSEDRTIVKISDNGQRFEMEEGMRFVQSGSTGLVGMEE
jgi:signal transduction histidine kinase